MPSGAFLGYCILFSEPAATDVLEELVEDVVVFVCAQLLPMLASALEFGGAPSVALGALLQIGKTLDEEAFTAQVSLYRSYFSLFLSWSLRCT